MTERTKNLTRRHFLKGSLGAGLGAFALHCSTISKPRKKPRRSGLTNILWIMTDDQRPDSLGCYGTPWAHTPNIDRLARRGVLFRQAVCQGPVCMPSRTSMLTGLYCHQLGLLENVPGKKIPRAKPLTERFRDDGYLLVNIGKLDFAGTNPFVVDKRPATYGGPAATPFGLRPPFKGKEKDYGVLKIPTPLGVIIGGTYPLDQSRTEPALTVDAALRLLKKGISEPFFLRVSIIAPHTPVLPPKPYDTLIAPASVKLPVPSAGQLAGRSEYEKRVLGPFQSSLGLTAEQLAKARAQYYGYVAFVDAQVGRLLAALDEHGLARDTIVVFSSDQGIELGEHGIFMKRNFYSETVRSPFIFSWPGQLPEGKEIETPVALFDLLPTLMDLVGIRPPDGIEGRSLVPLIEGRRPRRWREAVFSEIDYSISQWKQLRPGGGWRVMVQTERWKMCCFVGRSDKDGELYDLARDPGERRNLYHDRGYRPTIARLEKILDDWKRGA